ncbi:hypothetical protein PIB30_083282 [Stylosanthes scabra]|uniref:Ubiquitin-like protease family profile domain-containing protein n=1 Tax=Stylosanthes scabra TaxID=79078 RepID=A0ABU6XRM1_9FABA|nr:hypothetical protein [Stylosanthes scabra]
MSCSEKLVADEHCFGTREMLQSLVPGRVVKADVIDMVVGKMSHDKDLYRWFLPTIFSSMALTPDEVDYRIVDYMRGRYMGKFDEVLKVYVPLVRNQHWFLLIIDTGHHTMTYMDSYKDSEESPGRIKQLKDAVDFLEKILQDRHFFVHSITTKPKLSEYEFIEDNPPQQDEGSNDGGVWVAQWLEHSNMWDNYVTEVTDRTRMQIAIELVMGKHNPKADKVCSLAIRTWDMKVRQAKAQLNPRNTKRKPREAKKN